MITIKLADAVNSVESLNEIVKTKLPIKASYNIGRIIKKLAPEIQAYEEKKNELLKELGTPGEEKENRISYTFTPENAKTYTEKMKELLEVDVNLDFNKIKISELGEATIAPMHLADWLFEE